MLKGKIRVEEEASKKKDQQISKLSTSQIDMEDYKREVSDEEAEENVTHIQMKTILKDNSTKLESHKVDIKQLSNMVTKGDQIWEENENEITELNIVVETDKKEIKVKLILNW